MITEDYVSLEIAKLLKEKGFDKSWADGSIEKYSKGTEGYSLPTIALVLKWLRKVHNIFIEINYDSHEFGNAPYFSLIINMHTNDYFCGHNLPGEKPTYEEACEAAIKYCLENLI